jgi:hypothetical protein
MFSQYLPKRKVNSGFAKKTDCLFCYSSCLGLFWYILWERSFFLFVYGLLFRYRSWQVFVLTFRIFLFRSLSGIMDSWGLLSKEFTGQWFFKEEVKHLLHQNQNSFSFWILILKESGRLHCFFWMCFFGFIVTNYKSRFEVVKKSTSWYFWK